MIPGLAETLFAVLDGFRGTITDTGHAVGAVAAPDGLAVLDRDVVRRAELGALSTTDTGIAGSECLCGWQYLHWLRSVCQALSNQQHHNSKRQACLGR